MDADAEKKLNIMCAICTDFYKPSDTIFSTYCGHMFHHQCLFRWLNQNQKCPQCCRPCHRERVHRVYVNYGECTEEELKNMRDEQAAEEDQLGKVPTWWPIWLHPGEIASLPNDVIKCGTDTEGNDSYVARVSHLSDLLPAAFVPSKKAAYAPWGCRGHLLSNELEILLLKNFKWVAAENGQVPEGALATGYSEFGEPLYTGRTQYEGLTLLGKIHPSHNRMYMPYNGLEVNSTQYEVLVVTEEQAAAAERQVAVEFQ